MSTLSAFPFIGEQSFATPGAFNSPLSIISANIAAINTDVGAISGVTISPPSGNTIQMPSDVSISGYLSVGKGVSIGTQAPSIPEPVALTIGVNSGISDYIYFNDTANLRSDYLLGSHAGGTADGLNLFDVSGNTMIVSFSKQSIRFFQQVVGPVFDVGGALADTLNAATFGTAADSDESRLQSAIDAASLAGISRVYVPASMYPYSASSISFIYPVQMVREGGNWAVCDAFAYGARGTQVVSDTSAVQAALDAGNVLKLPTYVPPGSYLVNGLRFYTGTHLYGEYGGAAATPYTQLYQGSGNSTILRPHDPAIVTSRFIIRDLTVSAFGNTANMGGIDCVSCALFNLERVQTSGTSLFAIRVTGGLVAGDAGFGNIVHCVIASPQAASSALLLQSTTNDQPDGMYVAGNYINSGSDSTWIASIATVGTGAATLALLGNRFESSALTTSAITGKMSQAQIIGNRFETTASGGTLLVALNQAQAGAPFGTFVGNSWSGRVAWVDNGTIQSPLWGESRDVIRNELPSGTAITPGIGFRSEASLGWFRSAASKMALSYGTLVVRGLEALVGSVITVGGGFALNGDLIFEQDNNFQIGVASGGVNKRPFNLHVANEVQAGSGTAGAPTFRFEAETSLGWYRSGVSRMGLSYGQLSVPDGSNTTPSLGLSSATSVGFYSSGALTISQSTGTFNLATNSVRLSMRTIAASALTASAANTNVATNEVVFTCSGSGATLAISSAGTTWIFHSDASAKNT